jgi:uncharacterized protein with HEPN domain
MQRDEVVIQDIVNAARLVIEFVKGFDKDTFIYDWKTRSAVLYQLTVIGEAVKRLSKEFRAEYPQNPLGIDHGYAR